ncbi:MAG: hypothetical protein ABIB43_05175 [archaeon]
MKKKFTSIAIILLLILTLTPFVSAQRGSNSAVGDSAVMVVDIFASVFAALGENDFTMPIYGYQVSYLYLVISFLIILSLLTIAAKLIPIFQSDAGKQHSGARKMFVVSLSLLLTFGSPFPKMFQDFMMGYFTLAIIGLFIVFAILIWSMLRRLAASRHPLNAESRKLEQLGAESLKEDKIGKRIIKDEEGNVNNMYNLANKEIGNNINTINEFERLKRYLVLARETGGVKAQEAIRIAMNKTSGLIGDISKEDKITRRIKKINKYDFKKAEQMTRLLKDDRRLAEALEIHFRQDKNMAEDRVEAEINHYIQKINQDHKNILNIEQRINQLETVSQNEYKQVKMLAIELESELKSSKPDINGSILKIDAIIKHMDEEKKLVKELEAYLNQLRGLEDRDLAEMQQIRKWQIQVRDMALRDGS